MDEHQWQLQPVGALDVLCQLKVVLEVLVSHLDEAVGLEILEIDDLAACRALVPEAVTLIGLLAHLADELPLPAISEPVEQRHGNRTVPTIKDPAGGPIAATTRGGL